MMLYVDAERKMEMILSEAAHCIKSHCRGNAKRNSPRNSNSPLFGLSQLYERSSSQIRIENLDAWFIYTLHPPLTDKNWATKMIFLGNTLVLPFGKLKVQRNGMDAKYMIIRKRRREKKDVDENGKIQPKQWAYIKWEQCNRVLAFVLFRLLHVCTYGS